MMSTPNLEGDVSLQREERPLTEEANVITRTSTPVISSHDHPAESLSNATTPIVTPIVANSSFQGIGRALQITNTVCGVVTAGRGLYKMGSALKGMGSAAGGLAKGGGSMSQAASLPFGGPF